MLMVRLPKAEWGKAWRALIEVAPVRLVADDPIYEVLPAHLELLNARGFSYELVHPRGRRSQQKRRYGTGD
jgi:hypothetical protein